MDEGWVLVGRASGTTKAFGPFPTADAAREFCNMLGIPVEWEVVPLQRPSET